MLLKSCATPAASRPTESSFWARRNSSSARRRSAASSIPHNANARSFANSTSRLPSSSSNRSRVVWTQTQPYTRSACTIGTNATQPPIDSASGAAVGSSRVTSGRAVRSTRAKGVASSPSRCCSVHPSSSTVVPACAGDTSRPLPASDCTIHTKPYPEVRTRISHACSNSDCGSRSLVISWLTSRTERSTRFRRASARSVRIL